MERKHKLDLGDIQVSKKRATHTDDQNPWTGKAYSAKYHSILSTRTKLPVYQFRDKLIEAATTNQIIIVEGETGKFSH